MSTLHHPIQSLLIAALLLTPACGGGGGGGGSSLPVADPIMSSFGADVSFGTPSDGVGEVQLEIVLADTAGAPLAGVEVEFAASGFSNLLEQPALTDENGRATGRLRSTVGELKTVSATIIDGARPGEFGSLTTEFVRLLPKTFYLRQDGSDGRSGSGPLEAWGSLQFAVDQLQAGDTLFIGAGSYGTARITSQGTQAEPICLVADLDGHQTGVAGEVEIDAAAGDFGLFIDGANYVTLSGLTIHSALPGANLGGGIWIGDTGSTGIQLIDCALFENTRGLEVERAATLVVEGCSISNNRQDGLRLGLTDNASILNNLIYNNDASGVNIVKLNGGLTVGLNTFYGNQGTHLLETLPSGTEGSSAFVTGNLFTGGGSAALEVNALSRNQFQGDINLVFGNAIADSDLPKIGQSILADPLLRDVDGADNILGGFGRADDDFSLSVNSAALDTGIVNSNQLTLSVSGSAATKSTLGSGILDGEGADGQRINLGHHRPGVSDAYESAQPGDSRISFVTEQDARVRTGLRRSGQASWEAVQDAELTNAGMDWLVHCLAPTGPEELLATLSETGTGAELHVRHWNGRDWSNNLDFPVVRSIQSANAGERGFDIAYEQVSSDALLVYSNNDANPLYRTLSNGVWSQAAPIFSGSLGTGSVLWTELIPEAGSDRIALVSLDDAASLRAVVWNGSTWEAPLLLGTQIVELREFHSFAGAWESVSGDLMVMWGFSIFAEQARFRILDNQTKSWSSTQLYTNSEAVGSLIRMSSDPTSDRIAIAWGEGSIDDDVVVSTWDGDQFTNTRELSLTGAPGQHLINVGWIGSTGRAFAIYLNQDSTTFERARFDTFWKFEAPLQAPQMGRAIRAKIHSDAGDDFAEVYILDDQGSLFGFEVRFDGSGTVWTALNAGAPLAKGLSIDKTTLRFAANHRSL